MKFTFFIDQRAIVEAGFADKTDLVDWVLMDYIRSWEGSKYAQRLNGKVWICLSHIKNGLPLLGISDPSAFSRRLSKLADLGLIDKYRDAVNNKLYVETTVLYHRISHSDDQDPVVLNQDPVVLKQRINKSIYIKQDSLNKIQSNARANEKNNSLVSQVEGWYRQQGYTESIQQHLEFFVTKIATYEHVPRDLAGHFRRMIEEDWAGLRKPPAPDWATLPPPGSDLVRFIVQHGFPNRLRHLDTEEQCRFELKKLIAARLVEQKLNAA